MLVGFDCQTCGLGDVILSLWIAQGVREAGHDVLYLPGKHNRVIEAFGFRIGDLDSSDHSLPLVQFGGDSPAYRKELELGGHGPHRGHLWQMQLPFKVEPKRPCPGRWDVCEEWAQEIRQSRASGGRPFAVLFPSCAYTTRTWPVQKWTRLAWKLEEHGIGTAAFNATSDGLESMPFYAYGYDIEALISIILAADMVVANDSGPAHLAGTLGTKTFAVMGPTNPQMVFGYCPDVTCLRVAAGDLSCVGCHFKADRGFRAACDQGCEALHILPVESVFQRVLAEAKPMKTGTLPDQIKIHKETL